MGRLSTGVLFLLIMCSLPQLAMAQNMSADDAAEDLQLQGEYSGRIQLGGEDQEKIGVQIIALGDNQFQGVAYFGGLPGDGWDQTETHSMEAGLTDGQIVFEDAGSKLVLADGVVQLWGEDDGGAPLAMGSLARVQRQSQSLGKQPPEGATVLFDGSDGSQFTAGSNEPMVDGVLRQGIRTHENFGDCHLHIEFKLPFEPDKRDQARGNSGLYMQGRYEIQMLDSFGLSGEHNECGGIYSVKKPDVNMCYPPESWQTYDIDFTAARWNEDGEKAASARITVYHNGVLIHDDVEIPNPTTAAPLEESPEPGFIYLQDHGSQVRFRNIWLVEK
ncbi:MAG: 3-keto-disaccharide hydrolase [Pirellulaceae bacterium]